jgi:hypothetical protein
MGLRGLLQRGLYLFFFLQLVHIYFSAYLLVDTNGEVVPVLN